MYSNLEDWQQKLTKSFNKEEGQPYPNSNQTVVCGFVSTDPEEWEKFVHIIKQLDEKAETRYKYMVFLSNNERWDYINPNDYNQIRGKRFYKAFANKNIDKELIYERILPLCAGYCKCFEWF